MEEWKSYLMEEVIEEIAMGPFGSNIKVDCFVDSGVPVLNGSNLQGFKLNEESFNYVTEEKANSLNKANAHRGDIVITHRGTLGQIVYIPSDSQYERYVISQSQFRVRLNTQIALPQFVVYYFHTRIGQHRLLANASQVGVPAIARPSTTFKTVPIELPSLEKQMRIVGILDSLSNKIELNNRINHNLEEQAQALFKSWFVDFEPFKNSVFVKSDLGEIPVGWEVGSIYEIADIYYGAPFNSALFNTKSKGHPVIRIRDLERQEPSIFTEEKHPKGRISTKGDILVGMDGEFSSHIWCGTDSWINQRISLFQPKQGISHFFLTETLRPQLKLVEATESATTVIHIGKNDYDKFKVLIPPLNVRERFYELTEPLYSHFVKNASSNHTLAELRDSLLPKLMSGEIAV